MLTLAPSGYSTELALWRGTQSLILGAPRHQHTGKVVLFTQVSMQWRPQAEVTGTQVECGGGLQGQRRRRGRGAGPLGEVLVSGERWDLAQGVTLAEGRQDDSQLCLPDRLLLRGLPLLRGCEWR